MISHSSPSLGKEEFQACQRVLQSGYLASGPETRKFEKELAQRYGRGHAVAVSSGFAALHLSLVALGVKRGDSVVLPSYCCTALLNAVKIIGAEAEIVDTPYLGIGLDGSKSHSSGVVVAPQMFGVVQDLSGINPSLLIEDGAMSLGPGALKQGRVSIASFYATKMMTTGQGGAVLTDDEDLAEEVRDLISYDNRPEYRLRFNYAPTDLGSAIGRAQLKRLDDFLASRQELAEKYDDDFKAKAPQLLVRAEGLADLGPGLFRYWVKVDDPVGLSLKLAQAGVEAKSPVFRPLHRYLNCSDEEYPCASSSQNHILSLPYHPKMSDEDRQKVVDAVLSLI